MSHWKQLLAALALTSLAACGGGGGDAGTPGLGGASTGSVADVVIQPEADSIPNTGTTTVKVTITVVNANRVGLKDIPVSVSVDSDAIVSASDTKTSATGEVVATVGIGSNRNNRDLTLTARAGAVTKTTVIKVVTDPNSTTPVAADLALVLSAPSMTNSFSSNVTATATAVDANRNVVAGIPVTLSVNGGATVAASGSVTDSKGEVRGTVGIGSDRANRVITVTATSGSLVRTATLVVNGAKLSASSPPLIVAGSTGNEIRYRLVDFNALAMNGQSITVSGNGLPTVTGTTDQNGYFTYTYAAPPSPGLVEIVASAFVQGSQRRTRRWRVVPFHSTTRRAWEPGPAEKRVYPPRYSCVRCSPFADGSTPARSSPSQSSPRAKRSLNATSEVSARTKKNPADEVGNALGPRKPHSEFTAGRPVLCKR